MACLWLGVMSRFLSPFVCHSSPPQAFPPVPEERKPNSRLQERLLKKLGQHAHPFYFTVSPTEKTSISEVKDHVVCGEMFCYKNARSCCYRLLVVMWCKPRSQQVIATKPCVVLRLQMLYFSVQIPQNLPCSVTLQPGPEDTGKVKHTRIHTHRRVDRCVFIVEQQRSWFLSVMKVSDHHGNDASQ